MFDADNQMMFELESRRRIYEIVTQNAGIHFREVERKSRLSVAVTKHNLDYLTKHDIIKSERDGRNLRYYPLHFNLQNIKIMNLLRQEGIRKILLCMLSKDRTFFSNIVKSTGLSASTVSEHLKRLEEKNIIKPHNKDNKTYYSLIINKNDLVRLLIAYRESFLDRLVDRIIDTWEF